MKRALLILSLCCTIGVAQAQFVVNYKRAADAYFQNKEYYAAATFYKKALNITSDTALSIPYSVETNTKAADRKNGEYQAMVFKLAEASRLYKNFADAEKYYAIAADFTDKEYATARYWYGVSLRANQKYDEAVVAFERYLKENPNAQWREQVELELASSRFAGLEMSSPRLVQLRKLNQGMNAGGSNYAPLMASDLYFTSSRPQTPEGTTKVLQTKNDNTPQISKKATPFINDLYVSKNEEGVRGLNIKRPAGTEFAAATLTPDGSRMFFTAWKTDDVVKKYEIWSVARRSDNTWGDPARVSNSLNDSGNNKQPFVTPDGKFIVFASDRSGGRGKFDLWYAALRADGTTGQPMNLGNLVNSAGDEEAPYYNGITKKLRYSSNGMVGMGGFDFYESRGDFATWTKPVNMGYPFNSSKDDIYFAATNAIGSEGYISTDRESLCCLELFAVRMETITIKGILTDCKTNKPVPNAMVTLTSSEDNLTATTDDLGGYMFKVASRKPLALRFEATGYFAKSVDYSTNELARADTLVTADQCITPFKVNVPIVLKNIYFEFNSAELNAPSMATLDGLVRILNDNDKIRIELSAHTDAIGTDEYNMDLSQRRAQSCVTYLITNGIAPERLTAQGYGESRPIAPNAFKSGKDNPEGRALNRRIEFKVIENTLAGGE